MKRVIFLAIFIFIAGCTLKPVLNTDPLYEKALINTQRGQIINSFETKSLIDITYLNPLYPNKFKKPTFLVGVYNSLNNSLINSEFNLTINNKEVNVSSKIPQFVIYKQFPFYNSWMKYYIITTNTKKPFKIVFKSKHWGNVNFTF